MRFPTMPALLLLAACAARPAVATLETIATGGYAKDDSGRQAVLATTEGEYRRLWAEKIGDEPAPPVDFTKGVVVFLLAGSRPTGGWSVVPESVEVTGTRAVIHAKIQGPGRGTVVTQALTSPYAVVFVSAAEVKTAEWP
jgi:PrcB C-terminal